jgi:hypothetical protein
MATQDRTRKTPAPSRPDAYGDHPSLPLRSIEGWCSDALNLRRNEQTVVVGQDATAAGLVSWGVSQLQQLNVLLGVIGCAKHEGSVTDPAELCGAIRHQVEQVEQALLGAVDLLAETQRAMEPHHGGR